MSLDVMEPSTFSKWPVVVPSAMGINEQVVLIVFSALPASKVISSTVAIDSSAITNLTSLLSVSNVVPALYDVLA